MLVDVAEEHLEELEGLFERRLLAFQMLDLTRKDLAELDERLWSHLDGMLIDAGTSWELCRNLLSMGTAQAFVAALVAFELRDETIIGQLENQLDSLSTDSLDGVRWSAALTGWDGVEDLLRRQLAGSPLVRAAALTALARRGLDPGPALDTALASSDANELRAGLEAANHVCLPRTRDAVLFYCDSEDPEAAAAALLALARIEPAAAEQAASKRSGDEGSVGLTAIDLLGVLGNGAHLDSVIELAHSHGAATRRHALLALGNLGRPGGIPALLDALSAPSHAGVATVALRRVLGPCPTLEDHASPLADDEEWSPDADLRVFWREEIESYVIDRTGSIEPGQRLRHGMPFVPGVRLEETPLPLVHLEDIEVAIAEQTG